MSKPLYVKPGQDMRDFYYIMEARNSLIKKLRQLRIKYRRRRYKTDNYSYNWRNR